MFSNKLANLNKIFNNKFSVCIAVDHGFMSDPTDNVKNIGNVLEQIVKGGADGILISYGQAQNYKHIFGKKDSPALLLRVDWMNALRLGKSNSKNSVPAKELKHTIIASVDDALEMGANAIVTYYVLGYDEEIERNNIINCAMLAEQCTLKGLPLIIEPMVIKGKVNGCFDAEMLSDAARIAQEIGADMLKIPYTGDVETFKVLKRGVDIPILILGGAKSNREEDGYQIIKDALEVGASGVVFGRKVTCDANPEKMVRNIVDLVHNKKPISEIVQREKETDFVIAHDSKACTGCGICTSICRHINGKGSLKLSKDEFSYKLNTCTRCGKCVDVCPVDAISIGTSLTISDSCNLCGRCIEVCPNNCLEISENEIAYCTHCAGLESCACVEWCPEKALRKENIG